MLRHVIPIPDSEMLRTLGREWEQIEQRADRWHEWNARALGLALSGIVLSAGSMIYGLKSEQFEWVGRAAKISLLSTLPLGLTVWRLGKAEEARRQWSKDQEKKFKTWAKDHEGEVATQAHHLVGALGKEAFWAFQHISDADTLVAQVEGVRADLARVRELEVWQKRLSRVGIGLGVLGSLLLAGCWVGRTGNQWKFAGSVAAFGTIPILSAWSLAVQHEKRSTEKIAQRAVTAVIQQLLKDDANNDQLTTLTGQVGPLITHLSLREKRDDWAKEILDHCSSLKVVEIGFWPDEELLGDKVKQLEVHPSDQIVTLAGMPYSVERLKGPQFCPDSILSLSSWTALKRVTLAKVNHKGFMSLLSVKLERVKLLDLDRDVDWTEVAKRVGHVTKLCLPKLPVGVTKLDVQVLVLAQGTGQLTAARVTALFQSVYLRELKVKTNWGVVRISQTQLEGIMETGVGIKIDGEAITDLSKVFHDGSPIHVFDPKSPPAIRKHLSVSIYRYS